MADCERDRAEYVLTSFPNIVHIILQPLPAIELNKAARVCKTWRDVVCRLKRKRKQLSWTYFELDEKDENGKFQLPMDIKSFIKDLYCEPALFITFCQTNIYEDKLLNLDSSYKSRLPRTAKMEKVDVGEFMKSHLPKDCIFVGVTADGVVSTSRDMKTTKELESGSLGLSCLTLPKLKGLDIFTFSADIYQYANRIDEYPAGDFDVSQFSTIPEGKDVKAILFFCDEPFCPPEIGYSLLRHYGDVVIAGGYVDNLVCPAPLKLPVSQDNDEDAGESSLTCLAFCGERLQVRSVIIKEDIRTEKEVEEVMKKLKDCSQLEQTTFAFMFACVGRGKNHYHKDNVESHIFRKYFPNTPLLGFFGNGEVGFNYLPKYVENLIGSEEKSVEMTDDKMSKRPQPKLYHAYTTIICLMSVT